MIVKEDRSIVMYILLSLVTCGILQLLVFVYYGSGRKCGVCGRRKEHAGSCPVHPAVLRDLRHLRMVLVL